MRRCASCRGPMHPLKVKKVEVDWCGACRALWFDRGELAQALGVHGAPALTREVAAAPCPACPGLLWFSRVDETALLACVDCAGAFVSEAALQKRGAVPPAGVDGRFTCARCGDGYPVREGRALAEGLVCQRCAPPPPEAPAQDTALDLLERLAAFLARLFR